MKIQKFQLDVGIVMDMEKFLLHIFLINQLIKVFEELTYDKKKNPLKLSVVKNYNY